MPIKFDIDFSYLIGDWVEAVLWGVYSVLFAICMRCIWTKRRTELVHFTTVTIVVMYLFATVHISLALRRLVEGFVLYRDVLDPQLYFANISLHLNVTKDYFYVGTMVLGDSIIVWRCFIVWNRNYWVAAGPVLMLTATAVGGLGAATEYVLPDANYIIANQWAEAMFITSLITNIVVTCLTAGRIWYQSRGARQFFPSGASGYTPVLLLVIESGLVISVVKSVEFGFWLASPNDGLNGNNAIYILYEAIVQVEGIVPTAIILAVTLGYTSRRTYAVDTSTAMSFRRRNGATTTTLGNSHFEMNEAQHSVQETKTSILQGSDTEHVV